MQLPRMDLDVMKPEGNPTQNSMTRGSNRTSTVWELVSGEHIVAFETALQDAIKLDEEKISTINLDFNDKALEAVTHTFFHIVPWRLSDFGWTGKFSSPLNRQPDRWLS
jgi:hypothetical protein